MSQFLKMTVIIFLVIALWIGGGVFMKRDDRPLHEQIAENMFQSRAVPKLEYCVKKYGDEFELSDVGSVISTRFPNFHVRLVWSEEEQTYKDNYIVYLRGEELEEVLYPIANSVFSECKLFVYGYNMCPSNFDKDTTALELLNVSEEDGPVVQIDIFTAKDPSQRDEDVRKLTQALQERGYFICINIKYLSSKNYDVISEDNYWSGMDFGRSFYKYFGSAIVSPDHFKWLRSDTGWREGDG